MEKRTMFGNSNLSGSFLQVLNNNKRDDANPNSSGIIKGQSKASDLQKISPSIICSANITRQSLNHKPATPIASDDDDEFFQNLKSEIDKDLSSHSRTQNCQLNSYKERDLFAKKRSIVDEETENVIKRFKKDADHRKCLQLLSDNSIVSSNCTVNNMAKERHNIIENNNTENFEHKKNIFTSNILDENFRNSPNKYIFQVSSKIQKNNILPSPASERTVLCAEYEESLFYELAFLTPPDNNSSKKNENQ